MNILVNKFNIFNKIFTIKIKMGQNNQKLPQLQKIDLEV